MSRAVVCVLTALLAWQVIVVARLACPDDPNCVCGGAPALELNCNVDGRTVEINLLPNTYISIKCVNATDLDYSKLPKCANQADTFQSVSFKDCPLPTTSFKDVLSKIGVSKTMALIFQNAKNISGYFDRKHFAGLHNLTKLLLSVNGITHLPDNLFTDINMLTWLNIRSNSINLSEQLFKPLERLETLEIGHNHMTNISSNLFSHLSYLRKLSLWQSNVTWFSKDLFTGVDVLEELDLSSNGLNKLPSSIFKPLKKLKKLTLFSNKFSKLPQNLFKSNDELETVIILNNDVELRELPKNLFGGLPNLKQIYIQRCGLERIPYDLFANSPQITNISLAFNDLTKLPESIFNDQINLLELDLSHNKLIDLKPKLFSSLVRLEKLNLCHNELVKISGSTFSSLLSLIDLNMENNNIETIPSYLFSNNRQRMSISLAYNQLSFEHEVLRNNNLVENRVSPFANTYNLRLLNLSHNKFQHSFKDWWINGHEIVDISYNSISYLWEEDNATGILKYSDDYSRFFKNPSKEVWISHNVLQCDCRNSEFIAYLKDDLKTKVPDVQDVRCWRWYENICFSSSTRISRVINFVLLLCGMLLSTLVVLAWIVYCHSRRQQQNYPFSSSQLKNKSLKGVIVEYIDLDEKFVQSEILPGMRQHLNLEIQVNVIKSNGDNTIRMTNPINCTTLVIFSPNYLATQYKYVDITKIRGEMMKTKNTIYVFTETDFDDSTFAFLMGQRDLRKTIFWTGTESWITLLKIISHVDKWQLGYWIKQFNKGKLPFTIINNNQKLYSDNFDFLPYDLEARRVTLHGKLTLKD